MNPNPAAATVCPLCRTGTHAHWPARGFYRCPSCALLIRHVPADSLEALYKGSWSDPGGHIEATGATDPTLARIYLDRLAHSLGRKDLRGLRILDFGAGRGAVLAALREAGADAVGIDPFGHGFLRAAGYTVHPTIAALPRGTAFDGILSVDVVEHLPNVVEDLASLRKILAANGWIYISTPNAAGIKARVLQDRWAEAHNPSHLFLFSPGNLALALERSGYRKVQGLKWIIDYRRNPAVSILHRFLQIARMDGELRFLGFA